MKPDRLMRTIDTYSWSLYAPGTVDGMRERREKVVLKLLRAEGRYQRAWVRKIVNEIRQSEVDGLNIRQYLMACDNILAALKNARV